MKVAVAGSRNLCVEIPENCIPENATQIITGGARGIDLSAREYGRKHNIQVLEILPEYDLYGRSAPLKRNDIIIKLSDTVVVFWDGKSRGTKYVIDKCRKVNKPVCVYVYKNDKFVKI